MMDRETIGMVLGWVVVVVAAWFAALALMGYTMGNIFPWTWTIPQRGIHLGLQLLLVSIYAFLTRPK